jgi:pimeloyl-ACP methyl ester carboxylesterase
MTYRDLSRGAWIAERIRERAMIDRNRRDLLATGAVAAAMAAAPGVSAQQAGQAGPAMSFTEKGPVRIHFEQHGSGFPLLLISGGGLNSSIAGLRTGPFDPIEEFKSEYRCIAADLRTSYTGHSSGPLDIDRPWDAHTDDQLGVMDHLGIDKFLVIGFCIGGPFIWNLLKRAPGRIVAAVLAQPSGFRPEMPTLILRHQHERLGSGIGQTPAGYLDDHGREISHQHVSQQPGFRPHRDTRFRAQLPDTRADHAG